MYAFPRLAISWKQARIENMELFLKLIWHIFNSVLVFSCSSSTCQINCWYYMSFDSRPHASRSLPIHHSLIIKRLRLNLTYRGLMFAGWAEENHEEYPAPATSTVQGVGQSAPSDRNLLWAQLSCPFVCWRNIYAVLFSPRFLPFGSFP
jgi:hypothetical protein